MAGSKDTDLQNNEYMVRNGRNNTPAYSGAPENELTDNLYYRDIEHIADLDVYHFGNIEKGTEDEDYSDLVSMDDELDDLDDLEQRIISAGLDELGNAMREEPDEPDSESEETTVVQEGLSEQSADEAEKPGLIIDVSMCEEMNFVMQLGGVILVRDISLKNEGDGEIRDIRVRITSNEDIISTCEETAPTLLEGEEWHIVQPEIRVNTSYLAFLGERTECSIFFEVSGKDRFSNLIRQCVVRPLTIMAYDQWKGNDFHTELIPAFIVPNQPFISELVTDSAKILEKMTGNPVLDAYLSDDPARIRQMAQAAYEAITKRRISEIPYTSNEEDILRRIRLSEKIRKANRASAYDITLIYLSCLEAMGLNPVMYLRREEAYAGLWLSDRTFDLSVCTNEVEAVEMVDSGEIILIDCSTMLLGLECSFDESVDRAVKSIFIPDEFIAMLDITRARREGVKPLPFRIHSDRASHSADRRSKKKKRKRTGRISAGPSRDPENRSDILQTDTGSRAFANVSRNMEIWKKRLYDPDRPNRLTDLKLDGKIIPLLSPFINDYVDMLSDVMYFGLVPRPDELEMPDELSPENCNDADSVRDILRADFRRKKVHTAYDQEGTFIRVRDIIYEAGKALEQYGKTVLYLAAGLLKWTELSSGEVKYAPLVLLPVETRHGDDRGRPFRISEARPQFNYALLEMMEKDYFLKIEGLFPLPRDYHGVNVRRVCELFRNAVSEREGWEVIESAFLGIFDLSGYFQRRMLEHTKNFREHHILRGLSEGMSRTDLDKNAVREERVFLPLASDRFQEYAVKAAMKENSFAVSGAAGSGKTQTIANIIANAVSRGKTVLFACEKTQAYRDVSARLEKIGLAPYCLYVQQGNVKLRDLLLHLKRAMQTGNIMENTGYEDKRGEVEEIGWALDGYAETMNSRHVCGYSLRELLDIYEDFREYPDFPIQGIDADSITSVILRQRRDMVAELIAAGRSVGHPKDSPLSSVRKTIFCEDLREKSENISAEGKGHLEKFRDTLEKFVTLLELNIPVAEDEIIQMISIAEFVSELRDVPSFLLLKNDAGPILTQLREYISGADAFAGKDLTMSGKWNQEFLHADMDAYLEEYNAVRSKLFFRDRAMKEFLVKLGAFANIELKEKEIPELLSEVKMYQRESELQSQRWEELPEEGRILLKEYSSYEAADELTRRVDAYRQLCDQLPTLMRYAYNVDIRKEATELADALPELYTDVKSDWIELVMLLDIDTEGYAKDPVGKMDSIYKELLENRHILENWIRFNELSQYARSNGLGYLVDSYLGGMSHDDVMGAFKRGVYAALIRSILDRNPAAGRFDADAFNRLITQFHRSDEECRYLSTLEIQKQMALGRPRPQESPKIAVELMSLKRAITTFGRGMTVRNAFDMWPDVIVRLCPCIMMSPSVCAEYITEKWPQFDVVIIDEASSVPVERAAGVIARGSKLILSGDICQDPVRDSILEMCLAAGLPEVRLGTHFRSVDERLFSFSNRAFYNGGYLSFPSPAAEADCIDYIDVPNGIYDVATHVNEAEAREVVRAVLDYYEKNKDQKCSLGVVAVGQHQQMRIAELLEDEYARNSLFAEWARGVDESLIVLDLLGAQGYERDRIILSVTAAGDGECPECAHLLGENGWRYLNTAVTRARTHMTVVSSVTAEEIRQKEYRSRGLAALADYLDYASGNRGERKDSMSVRRQKKAGVLKAIRKTLEEAGYITGVMVGESDFRVDLAVALPENQDHYILGILLDSENYSGIQSARDRDILIRSELLRRGWPVMNIWCMDWWTRRDEVRKRLLDALDYIRTQIV